MRSSSDDAKRNGVSVLIRPAYLHCCVRSLYSVLQEDKDKAKYVNHAAGTRAAKKCASIEARVCSSERLGEAETRSVDMLLAAAIAAEHKTGAGPRKRDADSLVQQMQDITSGLEDVSGAPLPRPCLRIFEAFRILNQLYEVVHTSHMETLTIQRICKVSCLAMPRFAAAEGKPRHRRARPLPHTAQHVPKRAVGLLLVDPVVLLLNQLTSKPDCTVTHTWQHGAAAGGVLCRKTLCQMIHLCPDLFLVRPGVDPLDESLLTLHLAPPSSSPASVTRKVAEKSASGGGAGGGCSAKVEGRQRGSGADVAEAWAGAGGGGGGAPGVGRKRRRASASFENQDLKQVRAYVCM